MLGFYKLIPLDLVLEAHF